MAVVLELLDDGPQRTKALSCATAHAVAVLGVDGLCAGLGTGPAGIVMAWSHGVVSVELEELQFTLGEGPGPDASTGIPVLIPDLADTRGRWPALVPAALALGVRAMFALPLRMGTANVGTLTAHRATPGPLAEGAVTDLLALADAVTVLMLHQQYSSVGLPSLGNSPRPPGLAPRATYRPEVHQAASLISTQLGVSQSEALVRLRAHAYAEAQPISELAAQVVARRLHFDKLDP
jgi:hypothetical protein